MQYLRSFFVALIAIFIQLKANAYYDHIEINGLFYEFNQSEKTARVVDDSYPDPDGVRRIKNSFYSGDIIIPDTIMYEGITYSVTSIAGFDYDIHGAYGAFQQSDITSIVIPETIKELEKFSFQGCKKLKSVTFQGTMSLTEDGIFNGCSSLEEICGYYNIGTYIQTQFKGCSSLKYINLSSAVIIDAEAFKDCTSLTGIDISNVSWLGGAAFSGCTSLTSIDISNVSDMGEEAFLGCSGLTSVKFMESETSEYVIPKKAFFRCTGLNSINIPNGIISIGVSAFEGCSHLTDISLSNVKNIDSKVFYDCTGLTDVFCLSEEAPVAYNAFDSSIKNTTLHVHDYALDSFEGKEPWSLFNGIVPIENGHSLTYYLDDEIYKTNFYHYGDTIIPEPEPEKEGYTFSGWSDIPEVMPAHDVDIYGTFNPTEVIIDGITYQIRDGKAHIIRNAGTDSVLVIQPFVEDRGRQYSVTAIPSNVFTNSAGITSITIPEGIENIETKAFYGCKNLATVSIPSTIQTIGERAFANIDKISNFTCHAETIPDTDRTAFENSYTDYATLYVPAASYNTYITTAPWSNFAHILTIDGTMPEDQNLPQCATPTIFVVGNKVRYECDTPNAEFTTTLTVEEQYTGSEVILGGKDITYTLTVYATAPGYSRSESAKVNITLNSCDTNGDGAIGIGDIVAITNIMAGKK